MVFSSFIFERYKKLDFASIQLYVLQYNHLQVTLIQTTSDYKSDYKWLWLPTIDLC